MYYDSVNDKIFVISKTSDKRSDSTSNADNTKTSKFQYDNPVFMASYQSLPKEIVVKNSYNFQDVTEKKLTALEKFKQWLNKRMKSATSKKLLYRRLPILSWLPQYTWDSAIGDLVAGITVALTLIPQGLAYSSIVGVPTEIGLYGSFLGCFIYIIFGSCKDISIGPTAIQALLAYQAAGKYDLQHVVLLCFFTGILQIAMGLLGLGFLVDFISSPVTSGFTSAAALVVVASLMKDILGIEATGKTFFTNTISIFQNIHDTKLPDAIVGFSSIIFLFVVKYLTSLRVGNRDDKKNQKCVNVINKIIWIVGIAINAILVMICGFIAFGYSLNSSIPFKVLGDVPSGLPEFKLPPFGYTEIKNGTEITHTFTEMFQDIGSGLVAVAVVGILENISICKVFVGGKSVDANQEMITIGLSNVANSFAQSFPGTGAIGRSALNRASGVKTTMGCLYSGILVMVSLLFFTPYFYYIPHSTLAAVIITAVIFMIDVHIVKPMWYSKRSDFIIWFVTFLSCLVFPLAIGIIVGIALNIGLILYQVARPKIISEEVTTTNGKDFLLLTPDRCLIFPSVDFVRKLVTKQRKEMSLIMDCSHIYAVDYTSASVILSLVEDFSMKSQQLIFYNLKPSVHKILQKLCPNNQLVIFYDWNEADELL